jgi:hypothetical protein
MAKAVEAVRRKSTEDYLRDHELAINIDGQKPGVKPVGLEFPSVVGGKLRQFW